ncbi:MAG TPA: D-alanyl-D-alanine carboxypeptidase family protein [Mesorhizobium sp.]
MRTAFAIFGVMLTFSNQAFSATPILVVNVDDQQVLYSEDAGRAWYPASTTKLMTAFVTFEAIRAGRVSMDTTVTLSANAMSQKFLNADLSAGRSMRLEDALSAVIAGSANEVSVALAETVAGSEKSFVKSMNDAAHRLGMTGSNFQNPNGLFDRRQKTTARDMALLGIAVAKQFPEHRRFFEASAVVIDGKAVDSHNELLTRFPGTRGLKTGFLCAAGNNVVALAERNAKQVLVVVMGATTERERNERAAMYLDRAFTGDLRSNKKALTGIKNDTKRKPVDMRAKLCSAQTPKYVKARVAMYPMGLPGQRSFLTNSRPASVHQIQTWMTEEDPSNRGPKMSEDHPDQ